MTEWLVRTADNRILGPWPEPVLKERILAGELRWEDEICGAGDYWFSLHEREELQAKLGIEAPPPGKKSGESEETQTETETAVDSPEPLKVVAKPKQPRAGLPPTTIPSAPAEPVPSQPPLLALFLTLGGLGLVIFVAFLLRAAFLSAGP